MKMMRNLLALFLILMFCNLSYSQVIQEDLLKFNQKRNQLTKGGLWALNSWAISNIAYGTVAFYDTPEGEAKYFHQMNALWNTVNLAIGVPGLIKAYKEDLSTFGFRKSIKVQHQTELAYLVNGAIDLSYITTGFILRESAHRFPDSYHQFRGYGNSFILQGGFLFLLDGFKYALHKINANRKLNPIWDDIEFSQSGLGLVIKL